MKNSYFFKAGASAQHQPFLKSYVLEETDFSENQFPHYLLFLESCLLRETTFSKYATFYSSYLFGRATFLQQTFSEELLFHSYGSFQSSFLYIYYCSGSHHRWLNKCFRKSYFSRRCFFIEQLIFVHS